MLLALVVLVVLEIFLVLRASLFLNAKASRAFVRIPEDSDELFGNLNNATIGLFDAIRIIDSCDFALLTTNFEPLQLCSHTSDQLVVIGCTKLVQWRKLNVSCWPMNLACKQNIDIWKSPTQVTICLSMRFGHSQTRLLCDTWKKRILTMREIQDGKPAHTFETYLYTRFSTCLQRGGGFVGKQNLVVFFDLEGIISFVFLSDFYFLGGIRIPARK